MKFYYDLHIHSCLSPCGDNDMTPCNITGMAELVGLDIIALTDHNSALNAPAAIKAADNVKVIAGMELETSENVHIVMLFPTAEAAVAASEEVKRRSFSIANRTDIYGKQLIMDENDNVIGEQDELLLVSTDIGVYDAVAFASTYGGVAYPAHIDRPSNGILQMLGFIDDDMGFGSVEISKNAPEELKAEYISRGYHVITSSDAHYLQDINERVNFMELDELSEKSVIDFLKYKL